MFLVLAGGLTAWALFCGWLACCVGMLDWALRFLLERLEDA
jgi:hypothetical protein